MMNRKILAMVGVSAMMIGLVACGSKAESNIAESATPAPTAEATPTPEPTEKPAESHDFDSAVNKYKTERNIEIKQYSGDSASDMADCDSGTDIADLTTLHDWLYSNGVTKESVQNDRDAGCKNPYLDGYLVTAHGNHALDKAAGTEGSLRSRLLLFILFKATLHIRTPWHQGEQLLGMLAEVHGWQIGQANVQIRFR